MRSLKLGEMPGKPDADEALKIVDNVEFELANRNVPHFKVIDNKLVLGAFDL